MLSMLFGVPYAIWLSWKVRKSRKATEEAVEFAQMANSNTSICNTAGA